MDKQAPSQTNTSIDTRLDALELLLQQLVFLLEAETRFTVAALDNWLSLVRERMAERGSAAPEVLDALARLQAKMAA